VTVAALRSAGVREVCRDDHAAVLKAWSKRYKDLDQARTQVACRLHQVLCELIPGGLPRRSLQARPRGSWDRSRQRASSTRPNASR
jgi:transposase